MVAISTFIGRDVERSQLCDLVQSSRVVTIVGTGGVGKTRLANEVAQDAAAKIPGGLRRVELASVAARDDIRAEVAGILGFPSWQSVVVALGDTSDLVLLDNCEHVPEAAAQVVGEMLEACPSLRVLTTSRVPLGVDGEHVFVLAPLPLPDEGDPDIERSPAVRLYEDRVRAAGARPGSSKEELHAIVELCRRLDGVPLAIELAAARARSLTATEMLRHLDRRFDLLRRSSPSGAARHSSLRTAIETSYDLLTEAERAFFRALGVFVGPFTAQLAHAVAAPEGADDLDTLDLLLHLVDRSLVVAEQRSGSTRYRLLDSLRHFAIDSATEAGEWDAVGERFACAMVDAADDYVLTGVQRWSAALLASILDNLGNLIAAVDWCIDHDDTAERAVRLVLPMWAAVHQFRPAEVASVCDRMLRRWPAGHEPLRPEALATAATAFVVVGRLDEGRRAAESSLADPAATRLARFVAHRALAIAARREGDVGDAVARFRAAHGEAAAAGMKSFERELAALVCSGAGITQSLDHAVAQLDEMVADALREGDVMGEVWVRLVKAHVLTVGRRPVEACEALDAADAARQGLEFPFGAKLAQRLHAVLETMDAGWPASRHVWASVIDGIAATGDLGELRLCLQDAAALARAAGDVECATTLLDAVPPETHSTVLPGLVDPEHDGAPVSRPRPRDLAASTAALRAVRVALAEAPQEAAQEAPAAPPPGPADSGQPLEEQPALLRTGDVWTVRFGGTTAQVRHLKGLDDIAVLVSRPDTEVHCLELMGAADVGGEAGAGLDDTARRQYQARIRDLQEEIDDARDANDVVRAERAEAELDALVQQLSQAFGLGGRARRSGSTAERARSAVTWRVRTAISRIGDSHPSLGRHLKNAVRTGTWCAYRPETALVWEVDATQSRSS